MLLGSKLLSKWLTLVVTYVGLFSTRIGLALVTLKTRRRIRSAYERFLILVPPGSRKRFAKVTETFFTEVGVLLFVFPVLDEYVQNGQKAMTPKLVGWSLAASLVAYGVAGALAVFTKEGQE